MWFYLGIVVLGAGLALYTLWQRVVKLKGRTQTLEKEVLERTYNLQVTEAKLAQSNKNLLSANEELARKNEQINIVLTNLQDQLDQAKVELSATNYELNTKNEQLSGTYENLRIAQDQLEQSEKMAALGQLVAGVAYEINTPIGVVSTSASNLAKSLPTTLQNLPTLVAGLSDEAKTLFNNLIERSLSNTNGSLSSREERQYRKAVSQFLANHQVPDVDGLAASLVKIGVWDNLEPLLPLFRLSQGAQIIELASSVGKLRLSVDNITLAVAKTQKIVFALRNYAHKHAEDKLVPESIVRNVETVLTIYNNQLKHGIQVVRNFADNLPYIYCYPDELNQVWSNIIHNAIQAMQGKGAITIDINQLEENVVVKITDNGPGIPPELMDKIFKPYFTTKPQGEGSVLGLDISRKIIEQKHGGKIWVHSVPGDTTFSVSLPIHQDPSRIAYNAQPAPAIQANA